MAKANQRILGLLQKITSHQLMERWKKQVSSELVNCT